MPPRGDRTARPHKAQHTAGPVYPEGWERQCPSVPARLLSPHLLDEGSASQHLLEGFPAPQAVGGPGGQP